MGILSAIKNDVEDLVKSGFDDKYISKSTGVDLNAIEYIINYFREQYKDSPIKINNRESFTGGIDGHSH